jgi:ATP-dependent helicase/nuclease subunit A
VLDPRDRHALGAVLRGPICALSDAALVVLSTDRGGLARDLLSPLEPSRSFLDAARFPEEAGRLADFRARFLELREPLLRLAPGEALATLVRAFDLDRIIAALPRAAARLGNVDRLVSIARERGGALVGFSRWLARQIADEADEAEAAVFSEEDDAVRLTTIHASKGLDFEAVVLVDLDAQPRSRYVPVGYDRDAEGRARFVVHHKGERGVVLPTRAWEEARVERRARELAERKRLTYVAITRAKRILALVGKPGAARAGSALETLLSAREARLLPGLAEIGAMDLLREAIEIEALGHRVEPHERPPAAKARVGRTTRLPIATTPLGVFRGCARRFELRFLLGLEEPLETGQLDLFEASPARSDERPERAADAEGDPRVLGRAAHRILELWPREAWGREVDPAGVARALEAEGLPGDEASRLSLHLARILGGPFARALADPRVVLHREEELSWQGLGEPRLALRGTVDLFVERSPEELDVIDYKLARPSSSLDRYAFQLRAYALALARARPGARVRAGILFLEGGEEPAWLAGRGPGGSLSDAEHDAFAGELEELAARLATARASGSFPPLALPGCRALGCGFVTACHRTDERRRPARRR